MASRTERELVVDRLTVDVWLLEVAQDEGGGNVTRSWRLFAQRPSSAPEGFQGARLRAVLQPIADGMVQAWHPTWEEWLTSDEITERVGKLMDDGWQIDPTHGNGYFQNVLRGELDHSPRPTGVAERNTRTAA